MQTTRSGRPLAEVLGFKPGETVEPSAQSSAYGLMILAGLQSKSHMYAGTVPHHVKAKRREVNRRARASRKGARRG